MQLLFSKYVLLSLSEEQTSFGSAMMPYWTQEQETQLKGMVDKGKSLEELAELFHRSPEAIRLKLKRSGLPIPLPLSPIKVTTTTTTPSEPVIPVKPAEHLIDFEGTMRLLLGAMQRLNEPNISPEEVKKTPTTHQRSQGLRIVVSSLCRYDRRRTHRQTA